MRLFSSCQLFLCTWIRSSVACIISFCKKGTIVVCELYHCAVKNTWKRTSQSHIGRNFVLGLFYMKDNCLLLYVVSFHI